jgi:hypothetical protein
MILSKLSFLGSLSSSLLTLLPELEGFDTDLIPEYEELYQTNYCDKKYAKEIRNRINKIIKKHRVDNYEKMLSCRRKGKPDSQLSLNPSV